MILNPESNLLPIHQKLNDIGIPLRWERQARTLKILNTRTHCESGVTRGDRPCPKRTKFLGQLHVLQVFSRAKQKRCEGYSFLAQISQAKN